MATDTTLEISVPFINHPELFDAIRDSVNDALTMCGVSVKCVGAAAIPAREAGSVTGMIGIHGKVSGFVTINVYEPFAVRAVAGLLQEPFEKLNGQVIDGIGEITNLIVGGIKGRLSKSAWAFTNITVPSVILGTGYQIAYARGLEYLSVTFDSQDQEAIRFDDRLMRVSVSLLRL